MSNVTNNIIKYLVSLLICVCFFTQPLLTYNIEVQLSVYVKTKPGKCSQ